MRMKISIVEDIKVGNVSDKIQIQQGDQTIQIGGGARVQELIDALLTVNYGINQSKRMAEIRKQREALSCRH